MAPKVKSRRRVATASTLYGALLVVLCFAPAVALGWGGTPHGELGQDVAQAFSPAILGTRCYGYPFPDPNQMCPGYPFIERVPGTLRPFAVIPQIDDTVVWKEEGGDPSDGDIADIAQPLRDVLHWNTMKEDDYDLVTDWGSRPGAWPSGDLWPDTTVTHFWDADEFVMNTVESEAGADTYPNAWMKAKILWGWAIDAWAAGQKDWAWMYLGHVLHLVMDQGIPCHAHDDWHAPVLAEEDTLEDWFYGCNASLMLSYSWSDRPRMLQCPDDEADPPVPERRGPGWPTPPGGLLVAPSNDDVITALSGAGDWADDPDLFDSGTAKARNLQKLFYLMYTVNQYGDFSPSDDDDGDSTDILGWANYNDGTGLIQWTNPSTGKPLTDEGSMDTISMNDWDDGDTDNNLTWILGVGWRAAFRAGPAVVDLFRKTVDDAAPISDVVATRADGAPVAEWNNSPVTVRITGATDYARTELGMPASGVWKLWGEVEGIGAPTAAPDGSVFWTVTADGRFLVKPMSTDYMGNVEGGENDFDVGVDQTPPVITLSDELRPNYLTSESFTPAWTATDATSGVAEETAYLDGALVPKDVPIDLALMAGRHTLEVYAFDAAGNWAYETFAFEVWIDTATSALPVVVNTKSGGEALMIYVEFPAPYDVGAIELDTCLLRPGGSIDLTAPFPVVGGSGNVQGELLGGVADRDKDGLPERLIRFDREEFLAAFGGVTGDVPAVVWGGLAPDGMPRFLGAVTVPVFTPPPK